MAAEALARLFAALPGSRLVGGSVRDALAGHPIADHDLATPDPPQAVLARLKAAGIKAVPTGLAHGTVTATIGGTPFEVTTLRRDLATDGRHAEVAWTDDWREDAARRDFTINAMSREPDGTLHDYFGGQADLRDRRVRFVGNAAERVREDFLRILRFFRFQARYGAVPDPAALDAIRANVAGLAQLSPERVWAELKRILAAPDPVPVLRLMAETGVLAAAVPEGADPSGVAGLPPDPVLRTAGLLRGNPAAFAARLRLSGAEAERLAALRHPPVAGDDDALRRALADTPADVLDGRLWLAGAEPAMHARLAALARPVFPLAGRDALAAGVPPGPAVGALLAGVRNWWLAGGCRAGPEACRAELLARLAAG